MLKPYFTTENIKINIKDYIEVNSAIAIAMQGIGYGIKSMNFKKQTLIDQLPDWLKLDVSLGKKEKKSINFDLSGKLDQTEKWLLRSATGVLMLIILYSAFSIYLDNKIKDKIIDADDVILYTDTQIAAINNDINQVTTKSNKYQEMTDNLKNINKEVEANLNFKGAIPNLLMEIMTTIPKDVQITQIENTADQQSRHIVIKAQSKYYDELGYFKAKLKEDKILINVVSTQGEKVDDLVKIVIEGDLP